MKYIDIKGENQGYKYIKADFIQKVINGNTRLINNSR